MSQLPQTLSQNDVPKAVGQLPQEREPSPLALVAVGQLPQERARVGAVESSRVDEPKRLDLEQLLPWVRTVPGLEVHPSDSGEKLLVSTCSSTR